MKILITGGKGMLGRTLQKEFQDCELIIADLPEADITDPAGFDAFLAKASPDVVIHCAAMTAVDKCETEIDFAYKLNAFGTASVAAACHRHHVRLIAISTDYVFDGKGTSPRKPDDPPGNALNYYGITKLEGEKLTAALVEKFFIVRISWAFGFSANNFVRAILRASEKHDELKVVNDQYGVPTYMPDAAQILAQMAESNRYGYYHLTNTGEFITWYEFAKEIIRQTGKNTRIIPVLHS